MGKVWGSGEWGGWVRPSQAEGTAYAKSQADEATGSWQKGGKVEGGSGGLRQAACEESGALCEGSGSPGGQFRQGGPFGGLLAAWRWGGRWQDVGRQARRLL